MQLRSQLRQTRVLTGLGCEPGPKVVWDSGKKNTFQEKARHFSCFFFFGVLQVLSTNMLLAFFKVKMLWGRILKAAGGWRAAFLRCFSGADAEKMDLCMAEVPSFS